VQKIKQKEKNPEPIYTKGSDCKKSQEGEEERLHLFQINGGMYKGGGGGGGWDFKIRTELKEGSKKSFGDEHRIKKVSA